MSGRRVEQNNIVLAPSPAPPPKIRGKSSNYVKFCKKSTKSIGCAFCFWFFDRADLCVSEQSRYALPEALPLCWFPPRQTPHSAPVGDYRQGGGTPMGSEKAPEIALYGDPGTPLDRRAAYSYSYSKVWRTQPPKIRNGSQRDPSDRIFPGPDRSSRKG